jgi:uncharacterized protein YndB with AHSA1/START domain
MTDNSEDSLQIRRLMPIARERLFGAWLDPKSLVLWMRPKDDMYATAEVDARVGGKFRVVMHHGGRTVEHWGEYLAIEPPSRLSFTWTSENTGFFPSVVVVDFLERPGGTEIVLSQRQLPQMIQEHREGWTGILLQLQTHLSAAIS